MADAPPIPFRPPAARAGTASGNARDPWAAKAKLKKMRVLLVVLGLGALALISTAFGMMMAVADELPSLEAKAQFRTAVNSRLYGSDGSQIALLTDNRNRIIDTDSEISPYVKEAVVAVEDKRFWHEQGIDLRGMARAAVSDVFGHGPTQGASTIAEQFVKNSLTAQNNRTMFEKLREAALAYHLEHRWSKKKILDQYLNTIYFGNGAYGIEAAARTYFGGPGRQYGHDEHVASELTLDQSALLAGMVASPGRFDPTVYPWHSRMRRDLVLRDMLDQHMITRLEYEGAVAEPLPTSQDLNPVPLESDQPYFSSWVAQQLVARYGPARALDGGLKVQTTLDPRLQAAAEQAISGRLDGVGPSASLVAIDNKTGAVKAMVGGDDYLHEPFNLATNGHRQPGSAMKVFDLAGALENGISPDSVWPSRPVMIDGYPVRNFANAYSGEISLQDATDESDNSVFAQVSLEHVGTHRIKQIADAMGIRTNLSTNPAMVLGGLKIGVTPLEMAYAYSTLANGGYRVSGTLASSPGGPVAFTKVDGGGRHDVNRTTRTQVLPPQVAATETQMLEGVIASGTGTQASIGGFEAGKTGTTSNYGDAWFVGFNHQYTVAVWVGYPNKLEPMLTEYRGGPVEGGSFPAEIWHDFMTQAMSDQSNGGGSSSSGGGDDSAPAPTPSAPAPSAPAPADTTPTTAAQAAPSTQTAPASPPSQGPGPSAPTPSAPTPAAPSAPTGAAPTGRGGGASPGR